MRALPKKKCSVTEHFAISNACTVRNVIVNSKRPSRSIRPRLPTARIRTFATSAQAAAINATPTGLQSGEGPSRATTAAGRSSIWQAGKSPMLSPALRDVDTRFTTRDIEGSTSDRLRCEHATYAASSSRPSAAIGDIARQPANRRPTATRPRRPAPCARPARAARGGHVTPAHGCGAGGRRSGDVGGGLILR